MSLGLNVKASGGGKRGLRFSRETKVKKAKKKSIKLNSILTKAFLVLIFVTPIIGTLTTPTIRYEVTLEKPVIIEAQVGNMTIFLHPVTDIMSLKDFFKLHPLLEPIITVLLSAGLLLFTLTFIQTWNLLSLVAGGELWEDWKYTVYGVASLLYAGYITLVCFVWGNLNSNYSIFNSPVFIIPVVASLSSTPAFLFLSFYRFRKKAELFIRTMD